MNALHPTLVAGALLAGLATAQSFEIGSLYYMSAGLQLPSQSVYPGIVRVDPFTAALTPFVQFSSNAAYQDSLAYDPHRDRLVVFGSIGGFAQLYALDANGTASVLSSQPLQRLAPRGDGLIYGYKPGSVGNAVQQIYYLDANNVEHVLLDVGGAAPWLAFGGVAVGIAPIGAMIYDPGENALFLGVAGDNTAPTCTGTPLNVSVIKVPLTPAGTALRAPATCDEFDVAGTLTWSEVPIGFSRGPQGSLVLTVWTNSGGPLPRLLRVDPASGQLSVFATTGYTGDVGLRCGVFSPTIGRAMILDGWNGLWRVYAPGETGGGTVLGSYGQTMALGGVDVLCAVTPIGPSQTLSADVGGVSVSAGGVQHLEFTPGPAFAGDLYVIVGSLTGWSPGFEVGGLHVPLNYDAYTDLTLLLANSPFFVNTAGTLPASGSIAAQIVLPPGVLLGLDGLVLHHAAIAASSAQNFTHASNAVPLVLLP